MISLPSQKRTKEEKLNLLRKSGMIPAVLYGPKISSTPLKVSAKEFEKVYGEAGESSLITLQVDDGALPVLIRDVQVEPMRGKAIHIDFYQPPLDRAIEITVPLVFEGAAPAVRDLEGTLIKNLQEVEIRALPKDIPHEIRVDISGLKTFEDKILVSGVLQGSGVEILRDPNDIVARVVPVADVEKELEKPIEEKVEEVEKVEEKKPAEEEPLAEEPKKEK